MTLLEKKVRLGIIGAAHGLSGEVRIKSFTEDPLAIGAYGPLCNEAGRLFVVHAVRLHKKVVIARIDGVKGRDEAQALNGTALYIERSQLPDVLEADEFYWQDLIGLAAFDCDGVLMGQVKAVFNFGGGDMLEIRPAQGETQLVPFSRAAVPVVDLTAKRLTIDPAAAGFDLGDGVPDEEPTKE